MIAANDDKDPLLFAAQHLRTIVELAADLHDQAHARAAHHEIPGGEAMYALGPVSSIIDYERRGELVEELWDRTNHKKGYLPWVDNDDTWEPPLQTLVFWSEAWRNETGAMPDDWRPTVSSEATWLGGVLGRAYNIEPHYDDFEADLGRAVARMEALLHAGERDEYGLATCSSCGQRLLRLVHERTDCRCPEAQPHAWHKPDRCCLQCRVDGWHERHDQGGLRDSWQCVGCWRTYDRDQYEELIAKDARDNATALNANRMSERFDVTVTAVRVWAHRGKIRKRGRDELGRMTYDVADVKDRLAEPDGLLAG